MARAKLYKRAKAGNLVQVSVHDDVSWRLKAVGLTMKSAQVVSEIQRGAGILVAAVQRRAPVRSGLLRRGVYSASQQRNNFVQLTRGGRRMNSPLKRPPVRGQVLVVSSVFYQLWVEKGRKAQSHAFDVLRPGEKRARSVGLQGGRKRGRPFFRPAIKDAKPSAEAFIVRRIDRLIMVSYERGRAGGG
jgi:hypothetical protein